MKKALVIFGSGEMAQLAHYYFSTDSNYEVVAFTVDSIYLKDSEFCGLPVVSFEDVARKYPPDFYDFFVAIGYSKLNAARKEKFLAAKDMGYKLVSFISSRATVLNSGSIGENCFILEGSIIQAYVRIGNNVTIFCGSVIGHHSIIQDHTFVSMAVVSGGVKIGEQCSLALTQQCEITS